MIIPFRSKFKFKIHVLNLRSNRFFSPPRSTPPPARSIPSGATSSRSPSPPSIPPVLIHALSSLRSPYVYAGLPTLLVLSPLFSSVLRTSPSALLFSILRFALLAFLTVSPPHDPERTTPPRPPLAFVAPLLAWAQGTRASFAYALLLLLPLLRTAPSNPPIILPASFYPLLAAHPVPSVVAALALTYLHRPDLLPNGVPSAPRALTDPIILSSSSPLRTWDSWEPYLTPDLLSVGTIWGGTLLRRAYGLAVTPDSSYLSTLLLAGVTCAARLLVRAEWTPYRRAGREGVRGVASDLSPNPPPPSPAVATSTTTATTTTTAAAAAATKSSVQSPTSPKSPKAESAIKKRGESTTTTSAMTPPMSGILSGSDEEGELRGDFDWNPSSNVSTKRSLFGRKARQEAVERAARERGASPFRPLTSPKSPSSSAGASAATLSPRRRATTSPPRVAAVPHPTAATATTTATTRTSPLSRILFPTTPKTDPLRVDQDRDRNEKGTKRRDNDEDDVVDGGWRFDLLPARLPALISVLHPVDTAWLMLVVIVPILQLSTSKALLAGSLAAVVTSVPAPKALRRLGSATEAAVGLAVGLVICHLASTEPWRAWGDLTILGLVLGLESGLLIGLCDTLTTIATVMSTTSTSPDAADDTDLGSLARTFSAISVTDPWRWFTLGYPLVCLVAYTIPGLSELVGRLEMGLVGLALAVHLTGRIGWVWVLVWGVLATGSGIGCCLLGVILGAVWRERARSGVVPVTVMRTLGMEEEEYALSYAAPPRRPRGDVDTDSEYDSETDASDLDLTGYSSVFSHSRGRRDETSLFSRLRS